MCNRVVLGVSAVHGVCAILCAVVVLVVRVEQAENKKLLATRRWQH